MRHHELKIDPGLLDPIIRGEKTFEVRRDDRKFLVGDILLLRETAQSGNFMRETGAAPEYTGKEFRCRVTFVLCGPAYMVPAGYAVLSIVPADPRPGDPQHTAQYITDAFVRLCERSLNPELMDTLDAIMAQLRERNRELRGLEHSAPSPLPMFHSPGAEAIYRERRRQVEEEGFTAEHDKAHEPKDLAHAAAYYCVQDGYGCSVDQLGIVPEKAKREGFPFPSRRDLEKAGELIAAALDRMGMED